MRCSTQAVRLFHSISLFKGTSHHLHLRIEHSMQSADRVSHVPELLTVEYSDRFYMRREYAPNIYIIPNKKMQAKFVRRPAVFDGDFSFYEVVGKAFRTNFPFLNTRRRESTSLNTADQLQISIGQVKRALEKTRTVQRFTE